MNSHHDKEKPKRTKINPEKVGRCTHCAFLKTNTASDYEWYCLILKDWICETHCCEIQLKDYDDTRKSVASQINWKKDPKEILTICKKCYYRDL